MNTQYSYNPLGQPLSVSNSLGQMQAYSYNAGGELDGFG